MPKISEAVQQSQQLQAQGKMTPAPPEPQPQNANIPPAAEGTGVNGPSRGSWLAGQVFDSDVMASGPVGGSAPLRSRTFPFSPVSTEQVSTTSGQAIAAQNAAKASLAVTKVIAPFVPTTPPFTPALAGSEFLGDWVSTTYYLTGNQVIDAAGGGGYYTALQPSLDQQPSTSPSYWQLITAGNLNSYEGTYNSGTAYTIGQIVSYGGAQYIAVQASTGRTPSASSSYWTLLGANALFMGTWSNATAYTANMIVAYQSNLYQCILANTNETPPNATYWVLTGPATLDDLENGNIYIKGVAYQGQSLVVPNPNFQLTDTNSVGIAGWSVYFGVTTLTAAQTSNPPQTNGTYCEITSSTLGGGMNCDTNFKVAPGDIIFLSAYMKSDGTFKIVGRCVFWDGAGNDLSEIDINNTTSTSWVLYSNTGTAPANTAYATIYFQREDSGSGSASAYVTDVQLACSSGVAPNGNSGLLNNQGNIPASSFAAPLSLYTGYNSSQTDAQALVTWSAFTITLANASTISVPGASTQFPIAAAPSLSTTSGSISSGTWYIAVGICYTFSGATYVCSVSPQSSITVTSSEEIVIASPTGASFPGAVGWVPLVNTVTGVLSLPSTYVLGTLIQSYIAFGTNHTVNAIGTYGNLTEIAGYSTTAGAAGFFFWGLATSTAYYLYPAWNISGNTVSLIGAILASKNAADAIIQSGDGYIALSLGSVTFTTPASSGGATAGGGGGGGGRGLE